MSESEFDDDDKSRCAEDETFAEFIQSIELNSCSVLSIQVGSLGRRELRMSEASLLVSMWVHRMWASNDESRLSISHTGQALLECDGYKMILTKARKPLTHLAKSHSFDQETILTMSAMSLVSSLLLHFSRRKRLIVSCNLVFNLSCRWPDFFIWFRVRAGSLSQQASVWR